MAIVINGSGTITGLSAGGLPDGSVDSDTLATGIDATKLADGTVTSAELQYINTLSSNAQTQIDGVGVGKVLQVVYTTLTGEGTTTNTFPLDSTTPQITEGDSLMSLSITPSSTSSNVIISCSGNLGSTAAGGALMVALFKNSDVDALHVQTGFRDDASYTSNYAFDYVENPNSTSAQTYKLRYGSNTGTSKYNRASWTGRWGGKMIWRMHIIEYTP